MSENAMNYTELFRVKPGTRPKLAKVDASFTDRHEDRDSAAAELAHNEKRLAELQYLMYAERQRSLLIVLQAMDAGGKDGTMNHVCAAMNPQGCRVSGFKAPTPEELAHDFLWRIHKATPGKGEVAIFNRSHYEDVLVVRVHDLVPKSVWSKRYDQINDFEQRLIDSGTCIVKFYLHIDPDEQLARFKQRLDDPARHWKISESDYAERAHWDDYQEAFEDALGRCSTDQAPWFIIPSNHKWFRNLAVSRILVETLESLNMQFPAPTVDLADIARKYHEAAGDAAGADGPGVGTRTDKKTDKKAGRKSGKGKKDRSE